MIISRFNATSDRLLEQLLVQAGNPRRFHALNTYTGLTVSLTSAASTATATAAKNNFLE